MLSAKRLHGLLWLLCLALPGCLWAHAQDRREAPLPSMLTPESQAVLDKLASLSALPKPDWRYHTGDLPHGESPSLDDAGWQAATAPATLPAEALWMRATIEVPKNLNGYDLTGTQISFRLRVEADEDVRVGARPREALLAFGSRQRDGVVEVVLHFDERIAYRHELSLPFQWRRQLARPELPRSTRGQRSASRVS